jgi:hypothetical protein
MDYLNQYSNLVIAMATCLTGFATLAIVYLTCKQTKIAEQKRKDDLFKIRWEFYQEIIKYIKDTYEKKYEHEYTQLIDHDEEKKQRIRDDFIKSKNPISDEKLDIEQHFLISKAKLLFGDKVANLIKEFMYDHGTQLISKSVYQIRIDQTVEPHTQRLIRDITEKYWTYSWLPSLEFEQLFDEYLKLK